MIGFGGITDRLIPLFAIGAFLAFSMSQAGIAAHWKREGGKSARRSMALNLTGAIATGLTVLVVIAAKFSEGAWITLIPIPALLFTMYRVRRHYETVRAEVDLSRPMRTNLPIVNYVKRLAAENPERRIIKVIPELVERRWFQ